MAVNLLNVVGVGFFTVVLCWRIHRLYRSKAGIQAVAVTVAIAALTVSVLLLGSPLAQVIDDAVRGGASRLGGYVTLALGVAALAVAFFYGPTESARQRRAGMEAIPLVAAVIGLSVAMTATPQSLRNATLDPLTVQEAAFAVFFGIAGCYLIYGLGDCVHSLWRLMPFADGYLVTSLRLMCVGLGFTALGSLTQVVFVVTSVFHLASWPDLLGVSRVCTVIGILMFVVGLAYPGVRGFFVQRRYRRRHRADYERLGPLWRLLTDAAPEVVLDTSAISRDPHLKFQRRVVEIRDVLLLLSPYLPERFGDKPGPETVSDLTAAIDARDRAGPTAAPSRMVLAPKGSSMDDDAAPLLALSDQVEAARTTS